MDMDVGMVRSTESDETYNNLASLFNNFVLQVSYYKL